MWDLILYETPGRDPLSILVLSFLVMFFQSVIHFLVIEFKPYFVVLHDGIKRHPSSEPFVIIVYMSLVVLKYF